MEGRQVERLSSGHHSILRIKVEEEEKGDEGGRRGGEGSEREED